MTDNQDRREAVREKAERIVAALADCGYNFMKPEAVPKDVQKDYVNSIVRLIDTECLAILDNLKAQLLQFTAAHDQPMRDEAIAAIEALRASIAGQQQ